MYCTCVVGYKLNTITGTSHCSENASTTIPDRETKMASNWDGAGGSVSESGGSNLWKFKKRDFPSCNVTMRRGRGRLKKTTVRQDRLIRTVALRNRFVTAPEIKREFRTATGIRLSNSTVRNRLRASGLKARRPFKDVIMTLNHRRQRYRWAQHHQTQALRHWRHVMFSDESRFCLRFTDGRKRV